MAARLNITLTVLTLCARLCGLYASSVANNKRSSFSIVEHHPSVNPLEISHGEAVTLRCMVNDHYNSCMWTHNDIFICEAVYTWKWNYFLLHYNHIPDRDLTCRDDARFGIPEDRMFRNCKLTIDDIHHDDTGKWKCIVADRHLGIKDERLFNLKVVRSQESVQSVGEESLTWTPSFSIHKVHPEGDLVFAKEGSWETLSCHVTDHYDSCKWTHDTTECSIDFEWEWDILKASYKDVPLVEKTCSDHRLHMPGETGSKHQNCFITIEHVRPQDQGTVTQ